MSVGEDRKTDITLQSDGKRIVECLTPTITVNNSSKCCEFRQVYSSLHFIISTSHYQFS